jgi:hypothetical protein
MDSTNLPAPVFTAVDGITQGVAAVVYMVIGGATWVHAKRDIRTRLFLAYAMANAIVFGVPTVWWLRGMSNPTQLPAAILVAEMAALGAGALLLFHFTQVFPRRRPWINGAGPQMAIAYVLVPATIAGLVAFLPATPDAVTAPYLIAGIVFGFPLLVLLGLVLPIGAIMSLFRSHQDMQKHGLDRLKLPLELILLSQVAGGTLTILLAPLLAVLPPTSVMRVVLTVIIWALGLLTPLAYASAVWKFDALAVDPDQAFNPAG